MSSILHPPPTGAWENGSLMDSVRDPECPIRPGDSCHLCHPGSGGPYECGLVQLVLSDPALREQLRKLRAEARAQSQREPPPEPGAEAPERLT